VTTAQLDKLMRAVLADLSIVASPKAGNVGQSSRDSDSNRNGPPFVPDVVGYWARRYDAADDHDARRGCINGALNELREIRYGKGKADTRLREARLKIGTDPRKPTVVAHVHQCSIAHVYRLRAEAKAAGLRKVA